MRRYLIPALAVLLTFAAPAVALEEAAAPRRLLDVRLEPGQDKDKKTVVIAVSAPAEYLAYPLREPRRLAVELRDTVNAAAADIAVGDELVRRIEIVEFPQARAARVEIWLDDGAVYEVAPDGADLRVTLSPSPRMREAAELTRRLDEAAAKIDALTQENEALRALLAAAERPAPRVAAPAQPAPDETQDETPAILAMVERWRRAWQGKRFAEYASLYSPAFGGGGVDAAAFLRDKKTKFAGKASITVGIENPTVTWEDGRAVVEFTQRYRSGKYRDAGVKTLTLSKHGGEWKIESETWSPIR
ncbi:MAG: AMIN domain-containing protein [Nitrospinae bacterium]|nr:AMIN domain-containing protein [Nitrospinota bacterium]